MISDGFCRRLDIPSRENLDWTLQASELRQRVRVCRGQVAVEEGSCTYMGVQEPVLGPDGLRENTAGLQLL